MIVYLVQLYKIASEFASQNSCDLFQIFDSEEKCLEVFANKNCYDWQIAVVGAFNTSTGCGVDGFVPYCLVNDAIVPTKLSVSAACLRYSVY